MDPLPRRPNRAQAGRPVARCRDLPGCCTDSCRQLRAHLDRLLSSVRQQLQAAERTGPPPAAPPGAAGRPAGR